MIRGKWDTIVEIVLFLFLVGMWASAEVRCERKIEQLAEFQAGYDSLKTELVEMSDRNFTIILKGRKIEIMEGLGLKDTTSEKVSTVKGIN